MTQSHTAMTQSHATMTNAIVDTVTKTMSSSMSKMAEVVEDVVCELAKHPPTTVNTVNNIDNRVSINVFLNDSCKDAMNMVDFVNNLEYRLKDLEHTGKNGYIEGVSRLMIEGLQNMDVHKRPIHCTDAKRDTLYIKESDEWTKEDSKNTNMRRAIRRVASKGVQRLSEWQDKNPTFGTLYSSVHETYMGICANLMGGADDVEDDRNFRKITKRVANNVTLRGDPARPFPTDMVRVGRVGRVGNTNTPPTTLMQTSKIRPRLE